MHVQRINYSGINELNNNNQFEIKELINYAINVNSELNNSGIYWQQNYRIIKHIKYGND